MAPSRLEVASRRAATRGLDDALDGERHNWLRDAGMAVSRDALPREITPKNTVLLATPGGRDRSRPLVDGPPVLGLEGPRALPLPPSCWRSSTGATRARAPS